MPSARTLHRSVVYTLALALALVSLPVLAAEGTAEERDRRFQEMIAGKRLVGQFTVARPQGDSPPQSDLYMVSELSRGDGDTWVFTARMSYGGGNSVDMPIPVEVLWAGETPVLTMTNQTIPNLGTFTARVLIYDGRYAGTWQHGPVGGHMWGRLEDAARAEPATP